MIIPIRCWSCGKPIAHLWEEYKERTENRKEATKKALDDLGVKRYCCRQQLMGNLELSEISSQFKKF